VTWDVEDSGISGENVWGCGDRAWVGIVVGADLMGQMASFCTVRFLGSTSSFVSVNLVSIVLLVFILFTVKIEKSAIS